LISWVIENLVKNAVDAMKGEGNLTINLYYKNKNILIDVKDSGSGMSNAQIRNAFKTGYSTKNEVGGWGLPWQSALFKNINAAISNYGIRSRKGTTFRIVLN
jgi:sensor histidine kinase regulating citrate/malate metabolism